MLPEGSVGIDDLGREGRHHGVKILLKLLNGSYAFFATGWTDGTSVQTTYNGISYIGSFTADGKGNITGGELDVNDPSTGITSYSTLGGTYDVQYGLDKNNNNNPVPGYQTGIVTLVPPGRPPFPITLAVSLSSIQTSGTPPRYRCHSEPLCRIRRHDWHWNERHGELEWRPRAGFDGFAIAQCP